MAICLNISVNVFALKYIYTAHKYFNVGSNEPKHMILNYVQNKLWPQFTTLNCMAHMIILNIILFIHLSYIF